MSNTNEGSAEQVDAALHDCFAVLKPCASEPPPRGGVEDQFGDRTASRNKARSASALPVAQRSPGRFVHERRQRATDARSGERG